MKRIIAISFLITSLFFLIPYAQAQTQVRVRLIQASSTGSNVDPSLKDVHKELGSLFNFTSYRLMRDENLSLSVQRPAAIPVHAGRVVEFTLIGQRSSHADIQVKILRDGKDTFNTQVRLAPGRTVLIGGPRHADGVAIIALSARF